MRWRNIETDPPPNNEMIWLAWEDMHPGAHWEYAYHHATFARRKLRDETVKRVMWAPIEPPGKSTVEDELREAVRLFVHYDANEDESGIEMMLNYNNAIVAARAALARASQN